METTLRPRRARQAETAGRLPVLACNPSYLLGPSLLYKLGRRSYRTSRPQHDGGAEFAEIMSSVPRTGSHDFAAHPGGLIYADRQAARRPTLPTLGTHVDRLGGRSKL